MNSQPIISIVLCTYNNADSLGITLRQLSSQTIKDTESIEIILVDNNSPDNTATLAQQLSAVSPISIRYFLESRQGLSHARNTGVEHARGEYILFTDDDAEIPSDWVSNYLDQIHRLAPDCLYSKITIIWDKPIPWWYDERYRPYFVGLDYGDEIIYVKDLTREFFGKNFCMKREVLFALGGFDPALGRSGTRLISGEETLIYRRLVEQQKQVIYFPDAAVGHRLKEHEYMEENIRKRFIDSAYSNYHIARLTSSRKFFNRPLGVLVNSIKSLMISLLGISYGFLERNPRNRFYHQLTVARSLKLLTLWVSST